MRQSNISIIGAPLDLGQGRRGVDMGPSALRVAFLNRRVAGLGYQVTDLGNVPVEQAESLAEEAERARYVPQIAATCRRLARMVEGALGRGELPVVIGGDHSVAIGTTARVSRHFRKRKKR